MPTYEERLREVRKRSGRISGPSQSELERQKMFEDAIKSDPSLVRSVGYAGEALREVPEKEVPLLTDRPELVTKERPTFFISERPEEVAQAKTAGAERAILGREKPVISFGKFGQIIEEPRKTTETPTTTKVPAKPSAEDLDLNEKWLSFREKYIKHRLKYDPDEIIPEEEGIKAKQTFLMKSGIESLDPLIPGHRERYEAIKKKATDEQKLYEDLAKNKVEVGKKRLGEALDFFKIEIRRKNPFEEFLEEGEGTTGTAIEQLHKVMDSMSLEAKQRYLQQPDVQEYARKHGIRGQDIGL